MHALGSHDAHGNLIRLVRLRASCNQRWAALRGYQRRSHRHVLQAERRQHAHDAEHLREERIASERRYAEAKRQREASEEMLRRAEDQLAVLQDRSHGLLPLYDTTLSGPFALAPCSVWLTLPVNVQAGLVNLKIWWQRPSRSWLKLCASSLTCARPRIENARGTRRCTDAVPACIVQDLNRAGGACVFRVREHPVGCWQGSCALASLQSRVLWR